MPIAWALPAPVSNEARIAVGMSATNMTSPPVNNKKTRPTAKKMDREVTTYKMQQNTFTKTYSAQ